VLSLCLEGLYYKRLPADGILKEMRDPKIVRVDLAASPKTVRVDLATRYLRITYVKHIYYILG
jgi:hypothetical protein